MRKTLIIALVFMLSGVVSAAPYWEADKEWSHPEIGSCYVMALTMDINNDGYHDFFISGPRVGSGRGVWCLDGYTGEEIWSNIYMDGNEPHTPMEIADLDYDGNYELVYTGLKKTYAVNVEDGSQFWTSDVDSGWHHFVILELDNHMYVYVTADHLSFSGKMSKLDGATGELIIQTDVWKPCYGGLSAADMTGDGDIRIFMSDRGENYPDGGEGKGISCFDTDLNLLWYRPEISCSSHVVSIIDDQDGDGWLDAYAFCQLTDGILLASGKDGEIIEYTVNMDPDANTHSATSTADIKRDGNLVTSNAFQNTPLIFWGITDWGLIDKWEGVNYDSSTPVKFIDVVGDDKYEFIVGFDWHVNLYDSNYEILYDMRFNQFSGSPMPQVTVTDLDNDGKLEIFGFRAPKDGDDFQFGIWETDKDAPNPLPRTDSQMYGEHRMNNGDYIAPIRTETPVIPGFELPLLLITFIGLILYTKKDIFYRKIYKK